MQLKIKRSQREGGMVSKTAIFCIDARVQFTSDEQKNITRYKLGSQVIYNSEASKRLLDKSSAHQDGSTLGALKSIATTALAAMKLNISINSLAQGQHIECKSLDELIGAEDAIMEACENLKGYLTTAATFDGREVLFDYVTGSPEVIAMASTPQPMLVVAPNQTLEPASAPTVAHEEADAPYAAHYEEPADYASTSTGQEEMSRMFEQIKTTFFALPMSVRIIGVLVLLYILFHLW